MDTDINILTFKHSNRDEYRIYIDIMWLERATTWRDHVTCIQRYKIWWLDVGLYRIFIIFHHESNFYYLSSNPGLTLNNEQHINDFQFRKIQSCSDENIAFSVQHLSSSNSTFHFLNVIFSLCKWKSSYSKLDYYIIVKFNLLYRPNISG